MAWIRRWFGRRRLERELDAELAFHLEQHVRDLIAAGVDPREARRQARLALGGVEQVKEAARDVRGTRWLDDLVVDTRYALRMLRKSPGFTLAAIVTLALGIGANTAVFSVADALFLRPLPVDRPNELFYVQRSTEEGRTPRFSAPAFQRYQAALPPGTRLAAMGTTVGMYLAVDQTPERVAGQLVSGEWFGTLGVRPALGRLIGPDDDRVIDGHPVAVLSHHFWTRRFGAAGDVVGRTIRLNGASFTVIGVAAPGFAGVGVERRTEVWIPVMMQRTVRYYFNANMNDVDNDRSWIGQDGAAWLTLLGRADPAGWNETESRFATVMQREIAEATAQSDSAVRALRARERLWLESAARGFSDLRDEIGTPLRLVMIVVGLVLLVACANLAGLLLARNSARAHEIAVRMSVGAVGGRLLRQVLTESLVLALLGGAVSLAVATIGGTALLRAAAQGGPTPVELTLDWRLGSFVAAISLITGVVFGLPPALRVARTDLYDAFRSSGRVVSGRPGHAALGRRLVVGQIGVSLAIVVVAGVLVRSVQSLLAVDPGYDRDVVLSARIDVRGAGYQPTDLPALYNRLEATIAGVPGVSAAALSTMGLASGSISTSSIEVPGKSRPPEWNNDAQVIAVSVGFLEATGIRLLRGRPFALSDGPQAAKVAIVTRALARRFFETEDVIGQRFGYDDDPVFEVIGVVEDLRPNRLQDEPPPMMFLPLAQTGTSPDYIYNLMARVHRNPTEVGAAIKSALTAAEPGLPVREIVTLGTLLERGVSQEQMASRVSGIFGILAALLAAVGLYGILSYSVARRTNELGVRLALGAAPGRLRWLVIGESMRLVGAGVVVGLLLVMGSLGLVRGLVHGVSPRDPMAVGTAVVFLMSVGLAAAAVPAWRASRVDPVDALRRD
ncbi:MAG: ABC transporter permease [Gemmatimonadales bacterium]|nr:ABC transporter permease [Gemmatimonadales bacterium]